ncbi:Crp/Fnr family transcriptional regulator [Ectothiorhodosinus mongolicus]
MMSAGNRKVKQRLLQALVQLPEEKAEMLADFAEFLAGRQEALPLQTPKLLPRSPEETVVQAMKRLSASYPMLDKARLLNETSMLMSQHVMQGRCATEVIEELEAVFMQHYQSYREGGR